jgi:hypothetical protein
VIPILATKAVRRAHNRYQVTIDEGKVVLFALEFTGDHWTDG